MQTTFSFPSNTSDKKSRDGSVLPITVADLTSSKLADSFDVDPAPTLYQPAQSTVLSVSDVSQALKRYVEEGFRSVRIRGEISGYKRHTSGHSYFALKDEGAVIDAVAWRGTPLMAQPEDGLEVIITGRITTYPGRSKYQIVVERMEAAGKGALMAILMERKERLQREGLFDRKRPLPPFPKRIGIVTSATGAVIKDILHRLEDRFPCHVLLWPAQVQGPGSIEQVVAGIQGLNQLPTDQKPDVLIVARGGGSLEDLWTFNEEAVVRAVANSQIPIISAIGHETDTTLCDYAADRRAPTPTAAAEMATPVAAQLIGALQNAQDQMKQLIIRQLRHDWVNLKGLARGLPQPQYLLETAMQRLDELSDRLTRSIAYTFTMAAHRLAVLQPRHPAATLGLNQQNFTNIKARFERAANLYTTQQEQRLGYLTNRLAQSSYTKILDKGFSWVEVNGALVTTAAVFPENAQSVSMHFSDGCVVIEPKTIRKMA